MKTPRGDEERSESICKLSLLNTLINLRFWADRSST